MLRARMDVERIAKLVEAQGGFRTFADEMPKDGDPISVMVNVPRFSSSSAGSSRVISVMGGVLHTECRYDDGCHGLRLGRAGIPTGLLDTFAVVRGWCGCRVKMVQASAARDSII